MSKSLNYFRRKCTISFFNDPRKQVAPQNAINLHFLFCLESQFLAIKQTFLELTGSKTPRSGAK